jgi:hypothetical protein
VTLLAPTDLTIEILRSIRDEVKQTNTRIDSTNTRLDALREELSARIVASEIRTATAITDLAYTVREMTGVLRAQNDLRPRVDRCEQDIAELKRAAAR